MLPTLSSLPLLPADAGWLPWVSEAVAKGTLLLLVISGATPVLRRASASTRHLVWSTGLVCLLALPVLTTLPWRIEILPAAAPSFRATTIDPIGVVAQPTRSASEIGSPVDLRAEAGPAADAAGAIDRGTPEAASLSLGIDDDSRSPSRPSREALLLAVLGLWCTAAVLFLARIGLGAVVVRRIGRRATPLTSPAWTTPLWEAADRLDLRDAPRLLLNDEVPLPFTYGILRPTIVLPASAEEWDADRRWAVLFHELGHIRRRDLLSHMIGRIACALYWFHPLVWLAARRARAECERACDDLVLTAGARPSTYADHLLQIVSRASWSSAPAVAIPMAQRREFEGRMLAILEPDVPRHAPGRLRSAAISASVAAVALFAATLAPASSGAAVPADESEPVIDADAGSASATPGWDGPEHGEPEVLGVPTAGTRPDDVAAPEAGSVGALASTGQAGAPVAPADTDRIPRWRRDSFAPTVGETVGQTIGPAIDGAIATGLSVAESVLSGLLTDPDFGFPSAAPTPARIREADPAAIAALIGVLGDPVVSVRRGAAHSLGELGDPRAVAALAEALRKDTDADVRRTAAWALGEIGDPAAVPALSEAVRRDASAEVRRMSAWALGEIDVDRAPEALVRALEDADADVRRTALWALGEIGGETAYEALLEAIKSDDPELRRRAAQALGRSHW